ncbi:LOW QUALITY PROTEIN: hypothetical protein U9M48_026850 [Paspalum notatum var. saurae]|uniref:CUE domain-containing protein n=1 Tax=Paspalum notatum var. saurae TaxID=547442 RepID=A0AAQ3TTK5_PASNO
MSAVVCGKRSSSIFADELLPPSPPSPHSSSHHQPAAKRFRRSPSHLGGFDGGVRRAALLHHLHARFPGMDPQFLERALEESGDDLDSAIKSLTELRLDPAEVILSSTGFIPENGDHTAIQLPVGGIPNGGVDTATDHPPTVDNYQTSNNNGSEWVELFVREMKNSDDIDDARARASRALEALEKSILERAGAEAAQNLHKENMMLKEQLTVVLRENAVLKRAVAIQHERQKEFDERSHEVQNLKQLVLHYQEQVRTLEINNYALTMHLKQAQQNSSIPGRFNPDVALPPRRDPKPLGHVQLLRRGATGEFPVEVEEDAGETELHDGEAERNAGADPSPGAERHELEVGAPEVRLRPGAAVLEPLRPELLGVGAPARGVPADRPRVDEHHGAPGHVVAQDAARLLLALTREEQRHRGVQAQSLLDDQLQRISGRASSGTRSCPASTRRTSVCALPSAAGCRISSAMAHCSVVAVVSLPALKRSYDDPMRTKMQSSIQCSRSHDFCPTHCEMDTERAYDDHGADGAHVEGDLQAAVLLDPQQHVQEVFLVVPGAGRPPLLVLRDDAVHEPGHGAVVRLRAARRPAERAREPGRREHVGQTESRGHLDALLQPLQERVAVADPAAHHGAHGGVGDVRGEERADVDRLGRRRRRRDGRDEVGGLGLAPAAERPHAPRAEQLGDAEPAELAPVLAVRRERDAEPVTGELTDDGGPWPRRERGVVRPHDLPSRAGRRRHDDGELAHAEQHERAVPSGQVAHGAVRECAHEVVQDADDRELPWPGRQVLAVVTSPELDGEEWQEEDHRQEEVMVG